MRTDFVLLHHSDRGSQYVSIRYAERLGEAGIEPSVGRRGDSYDSRVAVEIATLERVAWFNHHHLSTEGNIPPAEAEANYYRQLAEKAESSICT